MSAVDPNPAKPAIGAWRAVRSGAIAGAISAVVFTYVHDLFISDIWFSILPMVLAGVVCGVCVGWSYGLLFRPSSLGTWLVYNAIYLVLFVLLGVASVLIFEPITSVAAVIAANEPPNELFGMAVPMTVVYLLGMAAVLSILFGKNWRQYLAILLTCTILILLLGMNVSVIGLVFVPMGSFHLIVKLFVLIFVLDVVYAVAFIGLERNHLLERRTDSPRLA